MFLDFKVIYVCISIQHFWDRFDYRDKPNLQKILCNNLTEKFEKTERFEEQIEIDGEEAVFKASIQGIVEVSIKNGAVLLESNTLLQKAKHRSNALITDCFSLLQVYFKLSRKYRF